MIVEWDKKFPGRTWNVFGALNKVVPSHLMDKELFDFAGLAASGVPDAEGDTAFDSDDFSAPAQTGFGNFDEDESDSESQNASTRRPTVVTRELLP